MGEEITTKWLKDEGWIKTPSFTQERNQWWTKTFWGRTPNGASRKISFAYGDETGEVLYMQGFPYPSIFAQTVSDIEIFINSQLDHEYIENR